MPNYKDINNNVHFLESEKFESFLPVECVPITEEEAAAILSPTQEQIDAAAAQAAAAAAKSVAMAENKGNATIEYLTSHTPAQIAAYINSNVTDLASAKVVITRLAVAIGAMLR